MTIEEITKPGLVDLSFDDANTPPLQAVQNARTGVFSSSLITC